MGHVRRCCRMTSHPVLCSRCRRWVTVCNIYRYTIASGLCARGVEGCFWGKKGSALGWWLKFQRCENKGCWGETVMDSQDGDSCCVIFSATPSRFQSTCINCCGIVVDSGEAQQQR